MLKINYGASNMAIPNFQTLMLPMLELVANGEIKRLQAISIMATQFNLSDAERVEKTSSGTDTVIGNRTIWAVKYLVEAGLLVRPKRGCFAITDKGKNVLANKPKTIDKKFLLQFPEFQKFQKRKKPITTTQANGTDLDTKTPSDLIDTAREESFATLKNDILQRVLEATKEQPELFEKIVIKLLVAMGYGGSLEDAGKHLGRSGDGGIDGAIYLDYLGLGVVYIQAKRYDPSNKVGSSDVRDFAGAIDGENMNNGVFVTTSSFSAQALEYVKKSPKKLILINGGEFADLLIKNNVGVNTDYMVEFKKVDESFFIDYID